MDVVADVNGGNAEVARITSDLEVIDEEAPGTQKPEEMHDQENTEDEVKMDDQEVNGDVKGASGKKSTTPMAKRRLRKSKANSTSTIESDQDPKAKGRKRKLSEFDDITSDDSMEFNGFDMEIIEPGSEILQKLIAEAEALGSQMIKRAKRSLSKGPRRNIEFKTVDDHSGLLDASEMKMRMDDATDPLESDGDSDDDSKHQDSSTRSPSNSSSSTTLHRQRGVSTARQRASVDVSNPVFREPFKFGWKREVLYKGEVNNSLKKLVEIYYYTPKGKKVRSLREIAEFLNTKELTIDNFTFVKESTGINDPEYEIIREESSDLNSSNAGSLPSRKIGSGGKRGGIARRMAAKTASPPTSTAKSTGKWSPAKANSPASFKVKVAGKRGLQKKEPISPSKDVEILSPIWGNSPAMTRRNQAAAEKSQSSSYKTKRSLKAKVQEPCSIRCSMSMGLIPSLQCCVCLCLYHPECVGHTEASANEEYVCKNCQPSPEEGKKTGVSITPPPLIPISMLGSQNVKSSQLATSDKPSPPKLQKLLKSENTESIARILGRPSRLAGNALAVTNKMDSAASWFQRAGRDFFPRQDGSEPKPAQNIARLAGKRYIVVPKNNAMAVQPAITARPNKMHNNSPLTEDNFRGTTIVPLKPPTSLRLSPRVTNENSTRDDENIQETVMNSGDPCELEDFTRLNQDNKSTNHTSDGENRMDSDDVEPTTVSVDSRELVTSDLPCTEEPERCAQPTLVTNDKIEVAEQSERCKAVIAEALNAIQSNEKKEEDTKVGADVNRTQAPADVKKPPPVVEIDQRQYFMTTVSAGYNALSRVFQYLKVQELLRAARVCKMWRDLAAHPALWKTVRMKNSQVTDWDGLVATLQRHGTQHLDLRKMLIAGESDNIWKKFVSVIPSVTSLVKLELCRCPVMVVEEVIKACPQLEVLSAMSIKCDWLNLDSIGNLTRCQALRLKAISGMLLHGDLMPLQQLTQLSHLSLTSVKELGKKKMDVLGSLVNLESLELGECSDFPAKFGTSVLCKLTKLERLRLEKGQGTCCTFDILTGVSKLEKLHQLELVNFDVKNGFDKHLANCKNIKRLLIIPTYISQSATSNNMVLGGVTELSNSLTHFVWGVTLELLRVTELFVDQCNQMNKQVSGDSIPVLKPVPCLKLIEDIDEENGPLKADEKQPNLANPQVDILPLPQLQKLLLTALPKTRVKILKIPFHATWRQSISDASSQ